MRKIYLTTMIVVFLLLYTNELMNGQPKLDGFALLNPKFGLYGSLKGDFQDMFLEMNLIS